MARKERNSDQGPYDLYLMRHGIAADRETSSDDAKRALTADGKLKLKAIAKGLETLGAQFDWIVTSPLKRAVETGEVVADAVPSAAPRDVCEALAPGVESAQKIISFLTQHPERRRVLLIGHEPDLSELASELMGAGRSAHLTFKKGGCCLISFDRSPSLSAGQLAWWATPRILRKLGS